MVYIIYTIKNYYLKTNLKKIKYNIKYLFENIIILLNQQF